MTPKHRAQPANARAADTGQRAEAAALALLRHHGLQHLASNVCYRVGELDLVMSEGETTVFVEVRHRSTGMHGSGADTITAAKRRKLVRAAEAWLQRHPDAAPRPCRFDVVDAQGDPAAPVLEWMRDAFRADE